MYWVQPIDLDKYAITKKETSSMEFSFGKDCVSTKRRSEESCKNKLIEGAMGSIICSQFGIPNEQVDRFRSVQHQFEDDVCSFGSIKVRSCKKSASSFRTYVIAIIGDVYRVFSNANLEIKTTQYDKNSYTSTPEGCGKDCFEGNEVCSGDEHFCSVFGCGPNSYCNQEYDFTKSSIHIAVR